MQCGDASCRAAHRVERRGLGGQRCLTLGRIRLEDGREGEPLQLGQVARLHVEVGRHRLHLRLPVGAIIELDACAAPLRGLGGLARTPVAQTPVAQTPVAQAPVAKARVTQARVTQVLTVPALAVPALATQAITAQAITA